MSKPADRLNLAPNGRLVLSYLKSCFRETITGGKVTVGTGWSQVTGGQVDRTQVSCDGGKMQLSYQVASKSGASVFRDLHRAEQPPATSFAQPQFILHGASPMVEVKRGSKVVIDRVDQAGERFEIPGAGRPIPPWQVLRLCRGPQTTRRGGRLQGRPLAPSR